MHKVMLHVLENDIIMFQINKYFIILLFVFFISCTENKQRPFSFVQLCDTQLGTGGYDHSLNSFKMAVKQINKLDHDFVVICGDLVNNPNDSSFSDFKEIMKGFKMPCYTAPGNHDVGNIPDDNSLSYYRKTIGKDYYKFKNKGYSFIVTNTQLWKANVENESEKHDNWFKKTPQDKSVSDNPVFVIGHYPLYIETLEEKEAYYNIPINKRKEILNLFKQNNVKAYLTGHTHETVINNYENIQLISGSTISKNFDKSPLGFRVWKVRLDTITHHFESLQSTIIEKNIIDKN
jgi:3',5'-cyclic AMP phosphodiesterase CpdA